MTDTTTPVGAPTLDALARPSGTLAMVAMDQRDSLRTMFAAAGAGRVGDDVLRAFKRDVAVELGDTASGFLIDRHLAFDDVRSVLPARTGLVLAADDLTQDPGGPVEETALDEVVLAADADLGGVSAFKLLVIWRRDARRAERATMAERFVRAARERGVLSVLEPVVRATPAELDAGTWDQDAAVREAAAELSPLGPDLLKVQVPLDGRGTADEQLAASQDLARVITTPWVVLSQGVAQADFAGAVTAASRAGASGFLAGRALWSDVVGADDVPRALHERSRPRLEHLAAIVDTDARPWRQA
ncbi:hypothetical protein [Curtobacterium sp. 9128]|uniref:hypothetical protein n=1 Tax=Curtobacterium sp. 9128 TaxID=1793722 RepID=UPI0011A18007|nr:hypothetical protein [Curtobacterium sp. 9128]